MDLRIVCGGLCVAICTASIALAQSFSGRTVAEYSGIRTLSGPSTVSVTPKQRAAFRQGAILAGAAQLALDAGDYEEAEMDARQTVSMIRGDEDAQEILATALDAQGKTQEALQAYKTIYDEGDVRSDNELPYARLLLKTGNWAEAAAAYNRQLPYSDGDLMQTHGGFSPDMPRPTDLATAIHIGLGLEIGWKGYHGTYQERVQQAQGEFEKALALEPDSSLANYYVGYGLKRMGRRAEAQAAFRKAAALDQGDTKEAAQKELPETVQPKN